MLNEFVADERGLVAVRFDKSLSKDEDAKQTYYSEELAAMVLSYGKGLSEKQAQAQGAGRVKDAVITVPSYYN